MSVVVANHDEAPVGYRLLFSAEQEQPPSPGATDAEDDPDLGAEATHWLAVKTVRGAEGVLEPHTAVFAQADLPYGELAPGRHYRFRASVVDPQTGRELAAAQLARASPLAAPGMGSLGLGVLSQGPLPGSGPGGASGLMVGTHQAQRVNGAWTESGRGTITMATAEGRLRLEYTYHAQGPTAAELSATAQAHGELIGNDGAATSAEIISASATMTYPGFRRRTDGVISRSGASATGAFSGTAGGVPWNGILTLKEGTYTLDPVTGRGEHRFEIQLVRAVGLTAPGQAARLQPDADGR